MNGTIYPEQSQGQALELTGLDVLPRGATPSQLGHGSYKFVYTTGPFFLPQNAGSLDWLILNNATTAQKVRVTIFTLPIGTSKTPMVPGSLEVTIDPGETTHNANTYPIGPAYEVQVECNSRRVFPYVSVWSGNISFVIPGTGILAGDFIRQLR
jgi:hypothetical protein